MISKKGINRSDKKTWVNKRSIILAWFISYISILIIPLIISSIVYIKSSDIIEDEINRANIFLLRQVRNHIDNSLLDVEKLGLQIGWNPRVKRLTLEREPKYNISEYNQIMSDLKVYSSANNLIDNFYIFMKKEKFALTSETLIPSDLLDEHLRKYRNVPSEQWNKLLWSKHLNDFMPMEVKKDNGEMQKFIAFFQSLPVDNPNNIFATLIIMIDSSRLLDSMNQIQWVKEGIVLVLDKEDRILASTVNFELPQDLRYHNLNKDNELLDFEADNGKYTVSYTTSNITQWKYVSIIPKKVFWEKAYYIRWLITVCLVLSILLGGILTFFFLRKNYHPVSKLIEALANKAGISFDRKHNEYRFIQEAISDTIGEKEKINVILKQQRSLLKLNFINKLLKGKLESKAQIHEALASYEINFFTSHFAVMLFYIEDIGDDFKEKSKMEPCDKYKLSQFIITNVFEELAGQNNYGIVVEIDEMMACLINFKDENMDGSKEELMRIACEGQQFIQERFNMFITISISEIHDSVEKTVKAYQEAFSAMEYKIVKGIEGIILYNDIKDCNIDGTYYYPIQTEQRLINFIKAGDLDKAIGILDDIYEVNFSKTTLPLPIAKCLMFNLISTMIKTMYEINGFSESNLFESIKPVEKLFSCQTVVEINNQMKETLKHVCDFVESRRKDSHSDFKVHAINFIEKNYSNVNLNISMIADELGITPAYLSRQFKEYSGEGLLDYINKSRLDYAKKLLEEQVLTINDIARKVGYYDSNTFIRTFKKYEGITPGKYKELNI